MPDENSDRDGRFETLIAIMKRLRGPEGCPWDRKQSFDTLKSYLLEESYEVLDAIDRRDWEGLSEELGDLLLQPVFLAQMASEAGYFTIEDCVAAINAKLVRRHPHIFAGTSAATADDVKARWDEIKQLEKARKAQPAPQHSILDDVMPSFPALVEAAKLTSKAASVGFEWPDIAGVIDKLREEAAELAEARQSLGPGEIEHELGDMLFTLVNLARFMKVDPEQALRKTNSKFRKRFAHIEARVAMSGSTLDRTSLDQMEALWQEAKHHLA